MKQYSNKRIVANDIGIQLFGEAKLRFIKTGKKQIIDKPGIGKAIFPNTNHNIVHIESCLK